MSIWRLALTARWLSGLAFAVVFALVTSLFGLWQWDRRGQAVAEIQRVEANYDQPPVALEDLIGPGVGWNDDLKWRQVIIRGEYLPTDTLLVRTRPRAGAVGFEVVVPFVATNGDFWLVNRGWVPTGEVRDQPDVIPPAPEGLITLTARTMPGEPDIPGRSAPAGQLATISLQEARTRTGVDIDQRGYLALVSEDPAVSPTPLLLQRPAADEGPHLSYTFQWFLFGILGFIAWGYLLREEHRRSRGVGRPVAARDRDEDIEDRELDALAEGQR